MKKLPKVFQNNLDKKINNNKEYFYSAHEERNPMTYQENDKSIEETIDEIFNGIGYPFNEDLIIKTPNKTYETNLIYKGRNYIMTIDNDNIPINSIISLHRKAK